VSSSNEYRKLLRSKANKVKIINHLPLSSNGNIGDFVIFVSHKGPRLYIKYANMWHHVGLLEPIDGTGENKPTYGTLENKSFNKIQLKDNIKMPTALPNTPEIGSMYVDPNALQVAFYTGATHGWQYLTGSTTGAKIITFTSAITTKPLLLLQNTNADTTSAEFRFENTKNGGAGATNDILGKITFKGQDSGSNGFTYGFMQGEIEDHASGQEQLRLRYYLNRGGSGPIKAMDLLGYHASTVLALYPRDGGSEKLTLSIADSGDSAITFHGNDFRIYDKGQNAIFVQENEIAAPGVHAKTIIGDAAIGGLGHRIEIHNDDAGIDSSHILMGTGMVKIGNGSGSVPDGIVRLNETSHVPTSTTGWGDIYIKASDSNLYYKNEAGTETQLSTASGNIPYWYQKMCFYGDPSSNSGDSIFMPFTDEAISTTKENLTTSMGATGLSFFHLIDRANQVLEFSCFIWRNDTSDPHPGSTVITLYKNGSSFKTKTVNITNSGHLSGGGTLVDGTTHRWDFDFSGDSATFAKNDVLTMTMNATSGFFNVIGTLMGKYT
tara:strand:- start:348 stop:1997 length:1650 start_codon:yes stop_codon:yes gene_type:complete